MAYCFDTSSFIECWAGRYRRAVFQGLWEEIADLVETGEIKCPEEVLNEADRKDDGLAEFIKEHREELLVPLGEEIMDATKEVLAGFPRLTGQARGRNKADPFVIATARVEGFTVVTEEGARGTVNKPKIPLVCAHFGVPCMNVLEFIEEQGWTF